MRWLIATPDVTKPRSTLVWGGGLWCTGRFGCEDGQGVRGVRQHDGRTRDDPDTGGRPQGGL